MRFLDLAALAATPLVADPFDHIVVPGFVKESDAATLRAEFPVDSHGGLAPLDKEAGGPRFQALSAEFASPALTEAMAAKFGVPLADGTQMLTVRTRCQAKDGRIHTDSDTKLVTALLYFNPSWQAAGGALRLLRGADDIEDFAAEVLPLDGTLVAFRRSDRSFHGHKPYVGPRRYIMINWMRDTAMARRELMRHRVSAQLKRFLP